MITFAPLFSYENIKKSLILCITLCASLRDWTAFASDRGVFKMKLIPLTQGKFAMVDDEDFEELNKHKWHTNNNGNTDYAIRDLPRDKQNKQRKLKMHRIILGLTNPKTLCDHKDGNGLNNQRGNLRVCTHKENCRNKSKRKMCSSKYKGVSAQIQKYKGIIYKRWCARINIGNGNKTLGAFPFTPSGERDAAKLYNASALANFGEFARLNTIHKINN